MYKQRKVIINYLSICIISLFALFIFISIPYQISNIEGKHLCSNTSVTAPENVLKNGAWSQKGTKPYYMAKATYNASLKLTHDPAHAAAMVGNAANEGAGFAYGWHVSQFQGGGGNGIYQFTGRTSQYGWSPYGQSKAILTNTPGGNETGCSFGKTPQNLQSKERWLNEKSTVTKLADNFECTFERGSIPRFNKRERFANTAYKLFASTGGANSINSTANTTNKKCKYRKVTHNIVNYAQSWLGSFSYRMTNKGREQTAKDIRKANYSANQTDITDDSGFIYGILKHCKYKVPKKVWTTINMKKYCKDIPADEAHAGDLAVLNLGNNDANSHVAILEQDWQGPSTKVIDMGGANNNVNESTYGQANKSIMRTATLSFLKPIKK